MEAKLEHEGHCPSSPKLSPRVTDIFGGLSVGQIVARGGNDFRLALHYVLGDVAKALVRSSRGAVAVADCDGHLVGLFTENDVMRAFFEGVSPHLVISDWLAGGVARGAGPLLNRLIVRPWATLADVAERMVGNAIAGDCACHHVVVQEEEGHVCGVLSSHDMVTALACPEVWQQRPPEDGGGKESAASDAAGTAADVSVQEIMKPRDTVFTCPTGSTMKDVLKVLLMAQQNCALVVDEDGIYGIVTPRDAVRAFDEGVANNVPIDDWLRGLTAGLGSRVIACDARAMDAAALMAARDVNHLVVVLPGSMVAVGVLSSLDVVLSSKGRSPLLRSEHMWAGPAVGTLVGQHWHLHAVCGRGATLCEAAELLASGGATSATVVESDASPPLGLLTENELLRAYVDGVPRSTAIQDWLSAQGAQHTAAGPQLLVQASLPLTDAASLMLSTSEPGRPCHHLVVKGPDAQWLGIFSALDVARGLCSLCSELEVANTGADQTTVAMVMKPLAAVPTCKPSDSLRGALGELLLSGQGAALVMDGGGYCGIVTPRCALEAMAEGVPRESSIASWLQRSRSSGWPREVAPETRLVDAAAAMASRRLHHLVVAEPGHSMPLGVLSSLDLARGVASTSCHCPFVSLGWLRACKGPGACKLYAA